MHNLWTYLYQKRVKFARKYATETFLDGLHFLSLNNIPTNDELSSKLTIATGWKVIPVDGFVDHREYFHLLENKIFPINKNLRKVENKDWTQEPDYFHDVFGHLPQLTNQKYADLMQYFGKVGKNIQNIEYLERLYWAIVEFGLIIEDGAFKIFGASPMSSESEGNNINPHENIRYFNLYEILSRPIDESSLQPHYYVINNTDQLKDAINKVAMV